MSPILLSNYFILSLPPNTEKRPTPLQYLVNTLNKHEYNVHGLNSNLSSPTHRFPASTYGLVGCCWMLLDVVVVASSHLSSFLVSALSDPMVDLKNLLSNIF